MEIFQQNRWVVKFVNPAGDWQGDMKLFNSLGKRKIFDWSCDAYTEMYSARQLQINMDKEITVRDVSLYMLLIMPSKRII